MFTRLFVASVMLVCTVAKAATPPPLTVEYSADRTVETDQGAMQGSIIATPAVERSETRVGDMSTVLILRRDNKVGYMLMPAQKMYQEIDTASASKQAGTVNPEQLSFDNVGQEVVSGQATTKYRFVMKDRSAGGFLWYTATGIPVKMDVLSKSGNDKTRMSVTLDNIKIGPQDPKAFEVPAGYAKMTSSGMFGAVTGSNGPRAASPSASVGVAGEVAGAATDAAAHSASAEVAGSVAGAIDNPIARSAGVAAARTVLGKLPGLFRNKDKNTEQGQ